MYLFCCVCGRNCVQRCGQALCEQAPALSTKLVLVARAEARSHCRLPVVVCCLSVANLKLATQASNLCKILSPLSKEFRQHQAKCVGTDYPDV